MTFGTETKITERRGRTVGKDGQETFSSMCDSNVNKVVFVQYRVRL